MEGNVEITIVREMLLKEILCLLVVNLRVYNCHCGDLLPDEVNNR
jgi:hypothetical protein